MSRSQNSLKEASDETTETMLCMPQRPRLVMEPDSPDEYGRWEEWQKEEWGQYQSDLESLAELAVQQSLEDGSCGGKRRQARAIEKFPELPDLEWKEVVLTIDPTGDALIIQARRQRKRYQYASLGFGDSRTGNKCSIVWILLKRLADHGGALPLDSSKIEDAIRENAKTYVYLLGRTLREVMGITKSPFKRCPKGYELRCLLRDMAPDSYSYPDERFMKGAAPAEGLILSKEEWCEEKMRLKKHRRS